MNKEIEKAQKNLNDAKMNQEQIICKKCHKPFEKGCKCPYDEHIEEQLREERSKILKSETKNFGYKGKECQTKTIPKIRNSKLINGW